jgi:hypothetical protein
MMRRFSRHGFFGALAWALCSALYLWTAEGVSIKYGDRENAWHHYEYLVDGFLSGHLYLSREPAPALLALPDPYDPQANLRYRLWDATLYHGKYYLYYGPTPAVLLMLPWKVVTGHHLPQWAATAIFAIAGLGALALLLTALRRKYFPHATPVHLFFAIVLAGHVSWLPVILRRPAFWELPIVTAAALFWWSLFFLWKYHETGRRVRWALAAGIVLAFALGARPTYVLGASVVLLAFLAPFPRERWLRTLSGRLWPIALPLLIGGLSLLAYNYARFGNVREFGNSYQLWGMDERHVSHFSPRYFGFNLWLYLFSLPDISPYFPFLRTVWLGDLPADYIATEEMPGMLFAMPALVLGGAACLVALRNRRGETERSLRILVLTAATSSLVMGGILFCFAGGCSRYIVELSAGWTLVVGIGLLALFSETSPAFPTRVLRLLAVPAVGWTLVCVWLASFEFRSFARTTQPKFYQAVAETLNYPSAWVARRTGQTFGPVLLTVRLADKFTPGTTVLLSTGRQGMLDLLILERVAPGKIRLRLAVNDLVMAETPVLDHSAPTLRVECHAPWLYPPVAHPYWRAFPDAAERRERQTLFALAVDGVVAAKRTTWVFDATRFEPFIRTAQTDPTEGAWVEKLTHLGDSPRVPAPATDSP